jgi:hypothetical protein
LQGWAGERLRCDQLCQQQIAFEFGIVVGRRRERFVVERRHKRRDGWQAFLYINATFSEAALPDVRQMVIERIAKPRQRIWAAFRQAKVGLLR